MFNSVEKIIVQLFSGEYATLIRGTKNMYETTEKSKRQNL